VLNAVLEIKCGSVISTITTSSFMMKEASQVAVLPRKDRKLKTPSKIETLYILKYELTKWIPFCGRSDAKRCLTSDCLIAEGNT
jgi:hypothetical protein